MVKGWRPGGKGSAGGEPAVLPHSGRLAGKQAFLRHRGRPVRETGRFEYPVSSLYMAFMRPLLTRAGFGFIMRRFEAGYGAIPAAR